MNQAKRIRLADEENSVEDSDTTIKPRWDILPYPVIHTIAKVDLQINQIEYYMARIKWVINQTISYGMIHTVSYLDKRYMVDSLEP